MKPIQTALAIAFLLAVALPAVSQEPSARGKLEAEASKQLVNYVIRVQWTTAKKAPQHLQILTTEGRFQLNTMAAEKVKIDDSEIPITVNCNGTLKVLGPDKGRLELFLGRTVPYVTGTTFLEGGKSRSQYEQRQIGLNSTFVVTLGQPLVIHSDPNEEVSILVKRADE